VVTDAVVIALVDGSRLCLRPSGTEPKLKVYGEVVVPVGAGLDAYAEARRVGAAQVDARITALATRLALT
jgi:phosphomannomutase